MDARVGECGGMSKRSAEPEEVGRANQYTLRTLQTTVHHLFLSGGCEGREGE